MSDGERIGQQAPIKEEEAPAAEALKPDFFDSAPVIVVDDPEFVTSAEPPLLQEFQALLDAYDDSPDELPLDLDLDLDAGLDGAGLGGAGLGRAGFPAKADLRFALRRWAQAAVTRLEAAERDLAEARMRIATLERLADEDALLPIANRRAFIRELTRLIALARRHGTVSSLVYIDLNDMKGINDVYGHNAGDAALQHVACLLVDHVRQADVVGRLGGDEFGLLLVRTDQAGAEAKAASLARAIAARPLPWNTRLVPISIAVGAYCFDGQQDAAAVMEAADAIMYQHKQEGRLARQTLTGINGIEAGGRADEASESACSST